MSDETIAEVDAPTEMVEVKIGLLMDADGVWGAAGEYGKDPQEVLGDWDVHSIPRGDIRQTYVVTLQVPKPKVGTIHQAVVEKVDP